MLQQVQVPNGWKKVRTALEWTLWMEGLLLSAAAVSRNRVYQNREAQMQYLLLSAAVCRGIECIKIGDAVLPTVSYENCNGNCASHVMQLCVKHGSEIK
jgi:hypothetical protein